MKKLAIVAIAIAALAACAQMQPSAAGGPGYEANAQHPEWLKDPARGAYPYSGNGW